MSISGIKCKFHHILRKLIPLKLQLKIDKLKFHSCGVGVSYEKSVVFRGRDRISIGDSTRIEKATSISAWKDYRGTKYEPMLLIGRNCYIGAFNHITAINKIQLGDGVLTGKWVTITDNSHGEFVKEQIKIQPANRPLFSKGEVIIGKNVWICDKATITAGITIGDGCIVAANAVVTKSVPPYSLVAGNPARVIKTINVDDNE